MARKPRLHVPGGLYHVILRGNAQQDIFFADADREAFYTLLQEGVTRFGYRVHGFCLMRNHVHLVLQAGEAPLSRALQNLAFRYTRHVNQTRERVGHLFQGRYKALLVDAESYLLELVRYIHLNPVRARIVRDPARHPHSGHLGYLGKRHFTFLTTDWVLSQFDRRPGIARRRYARFVAEGAGEGHREDLHRGPDEVRVIGTDKFVERTLKAAGQPVNRPPALNRIIAVVCQRLEIKETNLAAPGKGRAAARARALIGWLAMRTGAAPLTEVARRFHRDLSTLSRAAGALDHVATAGGPEAKALRGHQNAIMQA